jgi:hypothetical protein
MHVTQSKKKRRNFVVNKETKYVASPILTEETEGRRD